MDKFTRNYSIVLGVISIAWCGLSLDRRWIPCSSCGLISLVDYCSADCLLKAAHRTPLMNAWISERLNCWIFRHYVNRIE